MFVANCLMVLHACAKPGMTTSKDKKDVVRIKPCKFDIDVEDQIKLYRDHECTRHIVSW